jgi:hypothetical protein
MLQRSLRALFRRFLDDQVAVFEGGSEQLYDEAMHPGEAEHRGLAGAVRIPGVLQVAARATRKVPAQRRPRRRLALMVGDRLSRLAEALTQARLGQLVDQQAERHDEGQRYDGAPGA